MATPKPDPSSLVATVNRNVHAEIIRKGYQKTDVEIALDMGHPPASRRFSGLIPWTLDELDQIAAWLEIDRARLFQ